MAAFRELARVIKPGGRLGLYLTNGSALDHKIEGLARNLLRKPVEQKQSPLGPGARYQKDGAELWVWQFDAKLLTAELENLGFKLRLRRCGEFSELQRRTGGPPRKGLLHANNLAYAMGATASLAIANIYVFERV